ncbi:hypothetical protein GQ53DRAFT_786243 [Thozetella sp. PMI_491]|nr:hypothetical protein GQ53DRAFT_786243 [Thozetella sp. PMI_491]
MSDSEKPVGYFSTFSILDPNGSTFEGLAKTQRRNRRVFVCIPCHRRKLKCDKRQPCSRCVQTGAAAECVYQPLPSESSQKTPPVDAPEDVSLSGSETTACVRPTTRSFYRATDKRARVSGTSHWASIASEFEEASPFIFGTDPQWEPRYRQVKGLKYLFDPVTGVTGVNFPFSSVCPFSRTKRQVLESLPPRQLVELLVECYFRTFEVTHRLLHPAQFWEELHLFWENPDAAAEGWLAQLCMMLALGCQAAPAHMFRGTGRTAQEWTDLLLDSAQFCFALSPYFMSPDLTTVRTLCMTVSARLVEIVKGSEMNQLVFLMGFLSRMAMTMQLHRTTMLFQEMPLFEAEMRKRIWVTIQLLELDVAMRTGTSYIYREQDADVPLNLDDTCLHRSERGDWVVDTLWETPQEFTDSSFQVRLAEALPLLIEVITTINSPTQSALDHERVLIWDAHLQHHLKTAESALSSGGVNRRDKTENANLQLQFFSVLVHRALLAIHHAYAHAPQADRSRSSAVTIIKSSLAILKIQQVWNTSIPGRTRSSSPLTHSAGDAIKPNDWLLDLCHDDFGTAMLYIILALRLQDFDGPSGGGIDHIPTREVAYAIQHRSLTFLRDRACRSVAHFKEFMGLSILAGCLQCLRTGDPMLPTMMAVADQVEQTILAGKQSMIWTGQNILMQTGITTDPLLVLDSEVLSTFA